MLGLGITSMTGVSLVVETCAGRCITVASSIIVVKVRG